MTDEEELRAIVSKTPMRDLGDGDYSQDTDEIVRRVLTWHRVKMAEPHRPNEEVAPSHNAGEGNG